MPPPDRLQRSADKASPDRMFARTVKPEILDHLPADDPEAVRSRRDLRLINFFMGNERRICRAVREHPAAAAGGIVEFGAGEGILAARLAAIFPDARVTAYDLAPRPEGLDKRVVWERCDVLAAGCRPAGGVLVANLFLHHFEGPGLRALGGLCGNFEVLVFNEPDRAVLPYVLGTALWPLINRVTRHDMHASIRAGFADGEIRDFLGLDAGVWRMDETITWSGARCVVGCRL